MRAASVLPLILLAASPAAGQAPSADPRGFQGARPTVPTGEEQDDPSDRRVLRRIDTRIENRRETRIGGYRFVDARAGAVRDGPRRPGVAEARDRPTPNPYLPRDRTADAAPNPYLPATRDRDAAGATPNPYRRRTVTRPGTQPDTQRPSLLRRRSQRGPDIE